MRVRLSPAAHMDDGSLEQTEDKEGKVVANFEDLRGQDLSGTDLRGSSPENLATSTYDTQTKWPSVENLPPEFDPQKLMEDGKNPGLGIKKLHEQGITGEGITVAIIDQKLLTTHQEYGDKLISYTEYGGAKTEEQPSMHGPAVASLLVGETCGVAPRAKLVYAACQGGNLVESTEALNAIIEMNKKLVLGEKIRVVSCSFGFMEQNPRPGLNEWIEVIKKTTDEGIILIDPRGPRPGMNFIGCGGLDKENPDDYHLCYFLMDNPKKDPEFLERSVYVPCDYRTFASPAGDSEYTSMGKGGMSWSVPYLAGIFALALQVNPDLKAEEIAKMVGNTATVNKKRVKIINPEGIIEKAKKSMN